MKLFIPLSLLVSIVIFSNMMAHGDGESWDFESQERLIRALEGKIAELENEKIRNAPKIELANNLTDKFHNASIDLMHKLRSESKVHQLIAEKGIPLFYGAYMALAGSFAAGWMFNNKVRFNEFIFMHHWSKRFQYLACSAIAIPGIIAHCVKYACKTQAASKREEADKIEHIPYNFVPNFSRDLTMDQIRELWKQQNK